MIVERLVIDSTLKVSLIVAVAVVLAEVLRRRSAALRHWILAAALACAAATPALQLVVPAWQWRAVTASDGVLVAVQPPTAPSGRVATTASARSIAASSVLRSIWWIGFALNVGVLAIGCARLRWLASRSRPVHDARWIDVLADVARRYGIRRPVALLQSHHPTLLATWGTLAPRVVLPADALAWSDERLRIVLGHELAHIRRGDWIVDVLSTVVRAVHWFNPIVWIACARLRRESEHACDDAVLNLGIDRTTYAAELVDLARIFAAYRRTSLDITPAPAMARQSSLERRVRAMLNVDGNRRPVTRAAAIAIVVGLLAVTLPLAGLGAQSGPAGFSGTLLDTIGKIMPNVPLTLNNAESGARFQAVSDPNGLFTFPPLPAGDYELDAQAMGFAMRYHVTLPPGQRVQRSVTMQLGTLHETITVARGDPAPERRGPRAVATINREPGPCDQSPVGGCIEPPTKIGHMLPRYPEGRSENLTVELAARVGTDGRVRAADGVMVSPRNLDFVAAAAEAIKQWRFTTTYLDGVPMEVEMRVTVNFRAE